MSTLPRVLVIDDDRDLTTMLAEYLAPEGFAVEIAQSGDEGLTLASSGAYSLVILDVMLPAINGLDVLRRLRTRSSVPVIMLTARGQEVDRIVGLEIGADDYLAKPFSARELVARMHAVLRRTRAAAVSGPDEVLCVGDVVMDVRARTVRHGGDNIDLTSLEFDVLHALLASAGEVVPRERTTVQGRFGRSVMGSRQIARDGDDIIVDRQVVRDVEPGATTRDVVPLERRSDQVRSTVPERTRCANASAGNASPRTAANAAAPTLARNIR